MDFFPTINRNKNSPGPNSFKVRPPAPHASLPAPGAKRKAKVLVSHPKSCAGVDSLCVGPTYGQSFATTFLAIMSRRFPLGMVFHSNGQGGLLIPPP